MWSTVGLNHAAARAGGFVDGLTESSKLRDGALNAAGFYEGSRILENADFVYVVCHGSANGPITSDNSPIEKERCKWGAGRLRWLGFDACRSLAADDPIGFWAPCFAGLRLLLGFSNETLDRDQGLRGRILALYLRRGVPIVKAWQWASQETNPWYSEDPNRLDWRPSPAWIRRFTEHDDSHADRWTTSTSALSGDDVQLEHWITYWGVEPISASAAGRARDNQALGGKLACEREPLSETLNRTAETWVRSRGTEVRVERSGLKRWWSGRFPRTAFHLEPVEAKALADDHFRRLGELDRFLETARVSLSQTRVRANGDRNWRTVAWNVTYRFTIRDILLSGPWGQAEVTLALDDDGSVSVIESFRIDAATGSRPSHPCGLT
jgi:hypothetical protein